MRVIVCTLFLSTFFVLLQVSPGYGQMVVINEVMSANDTTYADENGDYEDWIELYNAGDEAVSLKDYGLSDDADDPYLWVFPDTTIAPGAYLLVWASNKDRALGNEPLGFFRRFGLAVKGVEIADPPRPLHTNFKIKSAGEIIILSNPSGEVIDELQPVNIPVDISYGRYPDGADELYYFTVPSPGKPNNESYYERVYNQ